MEIIIDQAGWITDPSIKTLLAELKQDGYVQISGPLGGSRKNANQNTVFKICYLDNSQRPCGDLVIKIGSKDSLDREFKNYSEYVQHGPLPAEYKVDLYNIKNYGDKAILPIDFVNFEEYRVFADCYKDNPIRVLEALLNKILKPWHEISKPKQYDLKQYIISRLVYHQDNLLEECERLFPKLKSEPECLVQELKRVLLNPVFLLQKDKIALKQGREFWTVESIIHGDLNFNNILVDNESNIKLIDYENTREDIIFDDLARLECEIKFIYLKHYNIQSFWKGLLDFEDLLTKKLLIDVDELPDSAKEYEDIKQAARCIAIIRKRADEIITQSSRVKENAYWIELLIRTLKYVSYKPQDGISPTSDSQKKYALISALLLTDNYLDGLETILGQSLPFNILPGPHQKNDALLSKLPYKSNIHEDEKQKQEDLSLLRRALIAGQAALFLGPDAPKASNAPTKLKLSKELYEKYMGSEPTINTPDLLFNILLNSSNIDIKNSVYEDVYTIYKSVDLHGFYRELPKVRWKRIFIEYVDFLVERAYEELETENKLQTYENRFSFNESRNDESSNTVIIERPYGSARFYNNPNRELQLSAEDIAKGKAQRIQWHDLIIDIRAPLTILFYGFCWNDLKELYFDILENVKMVEDNPTFFWSVEELPEKNVIIEAKAIGIKIVNYSLENLLKEIESIEIEKTKSEFGEGITISIKNESILLDQQAVDNYTKYFEIIYKDMDLSKYEIGSFFKGDEINWHELALKCDVARREIINDRIEKKISDEINKLGSNKSFLLLGKFAGSGTTTIMKRLGFNLAKEGLCPVIYLNRLDSNTWKVIEEFYHNCGRKKFLILIDNVSLRFEQFREFYSILQSRRINNVILATARRDEWNQVMTSYIQNSGADIEEDETDKIKRFNWIIIKKVDDILTKEEKDHLLQRFENFGVLNKQAALRFGEGYSIEELKYSNLLPLCWAATEGKNKKFELIINEYYNEKLSSSERKIVDVVCALNLFNSEGITDRMLHRIIKVNWDRFKFLLNKDSMQQLIIIRPGYYGSKRVCRILPRNYGIAEVLMQPEAFDFPQRILQIIIENLSVKEGEQVEEDLLFNIVRSKNLNKHLADKSYKNKLFEFAHNQLPNDNRILQHWGIILYEHAREQGKLGYLEDPAWEESIEKLNQASKNEPYNSAIFHSLGMASLVRGGLYWNKYLRNHLDRQSFTSAELYFQKAIKCFKQSIELKPHDEHAYNTIAKIMFNKLEDLLHRRKSEEFENLMSQAHELLEECGDMVPIDKQVVLEETRARWNQLRGNKSKAEEQYWYLLEKNPQNHSVRYLLATILMDENILESYKDAEDVIDQAIAEGRRPKGFYKLKYQIAERLYLFDYPKLERLLNSLVEMNPDDPYLVFKYAVICYKNENYHLSDKYFKISERLRFGDPHRFDLRDYIWKQTNDNEIIKKIWDGKQDQTVLKIFEGNIEESSSSKGYVTMDISGHRLLLGHAIWGKKDKSFQEGQRIRFNMAFNSIGPLAINPHEV